MLAPLATMPASRASRLSAGLDAAAARHGGGIEGVAADRTTGIGSGAAARRVEASRPIAGLDAGAARHRAASQGPGGRIAPPALVPAQRHGASRAHERSPALMLAPL